VALSCSFSVFSLLHHCFLAKNIKKTFELLKYKIIKKQEGIDERNKAIFL
jgi:hypothetical protein